MTREERIQTDLVTSDSDRTSEHSSNCGTFSVTVPLVQSGNRVTGIAVVSRAGSQQDNVFDGTLNGNVLTVQFTWSATGCSVGGTMTVTATATTLNGGYTGGTSCGGAGNVGQISLTKR